MYSMDLGEREQAPGKKATEAPSEPANPEKVAPPSKPATRADDRPERTWAARRKGCPQWADDVEPF